jgi:hypothetical protein
MSSERISVTVDLGDRRVTIEGPESFVREEVRHLTGSGVRPAHSQSSLPSPSSSVRNERELIATKQPGNHAETVTLFGYWLHEQGQAEFNEDDIRRAYIRAGIRPPKFVSQALRDAKSKFDYIAQGSRRGSYQLTPHGDSTIRFDLPRTSKDAR